MAAEPGQPPAEPDPAASFVTHATLAEWIESNLNPSLASFRERIETLEEEHDKIGEVLKSVLERLGETATSEHLNALGERLAELNPERLQHMLAEAEQLAEILRPLAKEQVHGSA